MVSITMLIAMLVTMLIKISNAYINVNKMLLELITIASAGVNISVGCLIFFIYFKLKKYFNE